MKQIEKKQKKNQRILKNFFGFITITFYAAFFYKASIGNFQGAPFLYVIGAFIGSSTIPLICWILYGIVVLFHRYILKKTIQEKISLITNSDEFSEEFNIKLNSLKELLDVQAITPLEFDKKKIQLIRETERLLKSDQNIKLKQQQLKKLEDALVKGAITEEEYKLKVDNLL
jgi:uncharacterized membrane protein